MSTLPELMDAYRDLADHAPGVADLHLTAPHTPLARRGKTVRAVLGAVIAVILIVASVVYLRSQVVGKQEPPADVSQPRWPEADSHDSSSSVLGSDFDESSLWSVNRHDDLCPS